MTEDKTDGEVFEVIMDGSDNVVVTEEQNRASGDGDDDDFGEHVDDDENGDSDDDSTYEADLTWRSDPKVSLSDWTIHVVPKGSTSHTSYYCHKSVIAVGPRRSQFFADTFAQSGRKSSPSKQKQNQRNNGTDPSDLQQDTTTVSGSQLVDHTDYKNRTTRLELERLAADAFPALLDYMYSPAGEVDLKTDNATALFNLSALLGIKSLRKKTKDFWMSDMCMENISTYYGHARVFKDKRILGHAEEYCAQHIFEVKETLVVEILSAVDPHFFLRVVTNASMQGDEQASLRLSLLIAVYGNIHKNELSPSLFLRLTASSHLPTVEVKAASVLLELEDDICATSDRMTSLKERALQVISKNWEDACFMPAPSNSETEVNHSAVDGKVAILPRVTGYALEMFAKQTLTQAKRDRSTHAVELKELRAFKADRLEETQREEKLQKELEATKAELAELKEANDRIVKATKAETDNLRQAKLKLQSEVSELRRAQAVQDDMKKLRRVATGGASNLLKSKDNTQ